MFLILLIIMTLLLVGSGVFGFWAYGGMQDYKNNVQVKIDDAVEVAKKETATAKDNEFAEKEKLPLKDYQGPSAYNSIVIKYPKTWSAYVSEKNSTSGTSPVDGYFHPTFVPGVDSSGAASYALRVQLVNSSYATETKKMDAQIKIGKVRASAYVPARVQSVTGLRFDGEIITKKQGSMIMIPVRDKTLKIWTEAEQFIPDFNNIILPNYSFEP